MLPIVPIRGTVCFPKLSVTFDAAREKTVNAIEAAMKRDNIVFLAAQVDPMDEETSFSGIYHIGTAVQITQAMKMPGGVIRVAADGLWRGIIRECISETPYILGGTEELEEYEDCNPLELAAAVRQLRERYKVYFSLDNNGTPEEYMRIMTMESASELADTIADRLPYSEEKQQILETQNVYERVETVLTALENENRIMRIERRINEKVKASIDRHQQEYFLREQKKAIEEELGEDDEVRAEAKEYRAKIKRLRLKKEISDKLLSEVDKLVKMPPVSSDGAVIRTYLDTVLSLPWKKRTKELLDINHVQEILDRDHYGLEKVKERITEYLAVRTLTGSRSPVLCLVGPPGVGKTSIAKSVAEALNRKLAQISLGGVHDEADIRGHRKTYIGAMPGRITEALIRVQSKNPLMLLDEVDKMGTDYKGDPSAALLELLDTEQNSVFRDHYTEVPFDLSEVMFIMTANTCDTISRPLLDRMEVIEISGYTHEEKLNIAKQHLLPKALEKSGLEGRHVEIADSAVSDIITYYTREAGVRGLERELKTLCRKAAKLIVTQNRRSVKISSANLSKYLGARRFVPEMMSARDEVGVARGLAWTAVGGETLSVEVNVMKGTGKTELTGRLGDVMKESAVAAVSFIRSESEKLGIDCDFSKKDIHIHVPEGAVPKDGPSAGITMAAAAVSALTGRAVRRDVAMTGEITLRGRVLPIGGLKEKSLAAYRAGIRTVIIPEENKKDLEEIPESIRKEIKFVPVTGMDKVLKTALV